MKLFNYLIIFKTIKNYNIYSWATNCSLWLKKKNTDQKMCWPCSWQLINNNLVKWVCNFKIIIQFQARQAFLTTLFYSSACADLIVHTHAQMVSTSNLSESDNFRNYILKSSKNNQMENSSPSIFHVMKCHTFRSKL